jgi:hypothetical protein
VSNPEEVPTAGELPVTRTMLSEVRTELIERIEHSKSELRAEMQLVKGELREEIRQVKAEVHEIKVRMHAHEAGLHGVKAELARLALLVEEQNARNKVVLDALMAVMTRQGRVEHRVDEVEETVRELAAARSSG